VHSQAATKPPANLSAKRKTGRRLTLAVVLFSKHRDTIHNSCVLARLSTFRRMWSSQKEEEPFPSMPSWPTAHDSSSMHIKNIRHRYAFVSGDTVEKGEVRRNTRLCAVLERTYHQTHKPMSEHQPRRTATTPRQCVSNSNTFGHRKRGSG